MTTLRAAGLIAFLGLAAFANSLGNGFAYDDFHIIPQNPLVTEGDVAGAVSSPYWPGALEGSGLYRPVTVASFALEWRPFSGSPLGYHALNIFLHALVSVLLFALLLRVLPLGGALVGGSLFALHPLHVEAVANVVGRAELYVACFYLLACLLYVSGRPWSGLKRYARLIGIGACYALALGSKEMGVTLPGALLLLEGALAVKESGEGERWEPLRELPLFLLLAVVLGGYLCARYVVLGTVAGELPAPLFRGMDTSTRILTAVSTWPVYLRLLFFPLDLASDYAPGVLYPAEEITLGVVLGGVILAILAVLAYRCRRSAPPITLGILWFCITLLPVSNLFFSTGVLLAERTLYLPSMGFALVAGWAAPALLLVAPRGRPVLVGLALTVALLLFLRTVYRNPTWMSTYTVLDTLAREHPESFLSIRSRAMGLARVGEMAEAERLYDLAVGMAPRNYGLLVEAGDFHGRRRNWGRAEPLLREAVQVNTLSPQGYRVLASQLLLQGRGREGHAVALRGLARSGRDRELWSLVSESYVAKGDLVAAVRAREAALGVEPESLDDWNRLAEIKEAMGDSRGAAEARSRARALEGR